ncbi:MAG: hypothetical protein AB8H03_03900 [Saprospiraceae bacterium]
MQQKIFTTILAIFSTFILFAQDEIPANNYLQWGKIIIPINELVNGSNGRIKMSLTDVLDSANEPILLMKNGKDAQLKSFYFVITKNNRTASPTFVHIEDYDKKNALNTHGKAFVKKNLREGENIYFNNLKGEDSEEHFLSIEISYAKRPLKLNFTLPVIKKEETFGFQIHEFPNQPLKIKLDTTDLALEKIFTTYKKLGKYNIIHIPHFKTTRRYLTPKNILEIDCDINLDLVKNEQTKEIDLNLLSEFTEYNGYPIELKWGEMKTTDSRKSFSASGNDGIFRENSMGEVIKFEDYDQYDLKDAIGGRFSLSQGFQSYKIKRMKVYIIPKGETPTAYITDDINHPDLEKVLREIEKNTMILFSEIIIEADANVLLYFPTSLLFGIR